eukprot:6580993-Alexandrium_andersonii.AAC.1
MPRMSPLAAWVASWRCTRRCCAGAVRPQTCRLATLPSMPVATSKATHSSRVPQRSSTSAAPTVRSSM